MYYAGESVPKDSAEAAKWYRLAAEQGYAQAQFNLGVIYATGEGVPKDDAEAVKWYRLAAEQGYAQAQFNLGVGYANGNGVPKENTEAARWYRLAAEQGYAKAQFNLSGMYWGGDGVPASHVLAYSWASLAAANGVLQAQERREYLAREMTREQIAEAQKIAAAFVPKPWNQGKTESPEQLIRPSANTVTGSGFFVTPDGYFVTNHHVVDGARSIRVVTPTGSKAARVVGSDPANDLAILKLEGRFAALPVVGSRGLKLADRVATLGYPNPSIQGQSAKYSSGDISSLSGPGDDPRLLQISVPIQPGNSGGPLVDASGGVVGVVVAQLDKVLTLKVTGSLPENVNYAIKGTILLATLESVPGLAEQLVSPEKRTPLDAAEVAKLLESSCGLVIAEQ